MIFFKILGIERLFSNLFYIYNKINTYFCQHQMEFWDMKWYIEDSNSPLYSEYNGKIWKNVFCKCKKCGVKYRTYMTPKKWGKWIESDFTPTKNGYIEVVYSPNGETKSDRRDRILNDLLND
jgi:hypothetical protein